MRRRRPRAAGAAARGAAHAHATCINYRYYHSSPYGRTPRHDRILSRRLRVVPFHSAQVEIDSLPQMRAEWWRTLGVVCLVNNDDADLIGV
eukprot:COSAG02_NODE_1080_length_14710_cov_46.078913_12_plen_91_part_00